MGWNGTDGAMAGLPPPLDPPLMRRAISRSTVPAAVS